MFSFVQLGYSRLVTMVGYRGDQLMCVNETNQRTQVLNSESLVVSIVFRSMRLSVSKMTGRNRSWEKLLLFRADVGIT